MQSSGGSPTERATTAAVLRLSEAFDRHHLLEFQDRHVTHAQLGAAIDALAAAYPRMIGVREEGRSAEGRPVRSLTIGTGTATALLWTQMHGDESTATRAVIDIVRHLCMSPKDPGTSRVLSHFTLVIVPMLNPDGAERCIRRTALGIDMNRDALSLRTSEGRLLAGLAGRLRPRYAFNLHDQELSTVGDSQELTAAALLAPASYPPFSPQGSPPGGPSADGGSAHDSPSRLEAKRICAAIAVIVGAASGGRIARYSDALEPRAFGEFFQGKGAATVLFESGHMRNDPAKHQVRKLTFIGILSGLEAIAGVPAGAGVLPAPLDAYDALPFNGKRAYDVVIRNVSVADPRRGASTLDLGVSFQVDTHPEEPPRLVDMGDLDIYTGVEEIDGTGVSIPSKALELNKPFEYRNYFG